MKRVAKIILTTNDHYLFSIKNAPDRPEKHNKLEFFGGQVEKHETPLEALVRELMEEECSGVLTQKARKDQPRHREIDLNGDPHFIYHMPLTDVEVESLAPCPEESRGYRLIHKSRISKAPGMVTDEDYTPKTLGILKSLELI